MDNEITKEMRQLFPIQGFVDSFQIMSENINEVNSESRNLPKAK